jgi:hypothetical protein
MSFRVSAQLQPRLGDVAVFEKRPARTAADSEQKDEYIFVAPPYCQTACCMLFCPITLLLL